MGRADGFGAIAVRDVGERRRDDLGRRREIGRERIEAERLDDANEREGRRLVAAEIAAERSRSSFSQAANEISDDWADERSARSSMVASFDDRFS